MTDGVWDIVGRKDREIRIEKSVGDALRELVRKRFRNNAAKTIETIWGLDPKTAKNVVGQGNVSERTLTKAVNAERWALWMALGEELFDEKYEQHLKAVVHEREQHRAAAEAHADHVRDLEAKASRLVRVRSGAVAP